MNGKELPGQAAEKEAEGFFFTPAFQALTIGVPFCMFKMLFGLAALRAGAPQGALCIFAWLTLAWAAVDLIMNLIRVFYHLAGRASPIEYCMLAQAGRLFKRPRLFLAVDTLVSFSLICFVLWSGWIALFTPREARLWYAATTLNLISVSVVNIWIELRRGS